MRLNIWNRLLIIGLSFLSVQAKAPECANTNFVFSDGEDIKYKIYYNWKSVWVGAGTASFTVSPEMLDGQYHHHIVAEGKTFRKFDLFYKVRDRYESYVNPTTLLSMRFMRDVYEGGYTINHRYDFDREQSRVITTRQDYKTPFRIDTLSLEPCAHDIVSAIYYTRNINYSGLEIGDLIPVDIFIDSKLYKLHLKYLGKEIVKTSIGKFRCVKLSPLLIKGRIFNETDAMLIYVTDDDNRIPVLAESPISVGSVKAVLTDFKGIRHPMTALIEE